MSYSDKYQIGRHEVEIRRPWPGEAASMSAWVRRELEHYAEAAQRASEVATSGPPEAMEKAEKAFFDQGDALQGWVIGQLLVAPALPGELGDVPPNTYGRRVIGHLRALHWSPGEAQALYQVCLSAIAETRKQLTPDAVEVVRMVNFTKPTEVTPMS